MLHVICHASCIMWYASCVTCHQHIVLCRARHLHRKNCIVSYSAVQDTWIETKLQLREVWLLLEFKIIWKNSLTRSIHPSPMKKLHRMNRQTDKNQTDIPINCLNQPRGPFIENEKNHQIFWKAPAGPSALRADLEKNIFLWTLKFWEYWFGGKARKLRQILNCNKTT